MIPEACAPDYSTPMLVYFVSTIVLLILWLHELKRP